MNDKEIQEKYERSFKELTDTLSPQQIKLFECWFEVGMPTVYNQDSRKS